MHRPFGGSAHASIVGGASGAAACAADADISELIHRPVGAGVSGAA